MNQSTVWRVVITLGCRIAFESGQRPGVEYACISAYLMQREYQMLGGSS